MTEETKLRLREHHLMHFENEITRNLEAIHTANDDNRHADNADARQENAVFVTGVRKPYDTFFHVQFLRDSARVVKTVAGFSEASVLFCAKILINMSTD